MSHTFSLPDLLLGMDPHGSTFSSYTFIMKRRVRILFSSIAGVAHHLGSMGGCFCSIVPSASAAAKNSPALCTLDKFRWSMEGDTVRRGCAPLSLLPFMPPAVT